MMYARLEKSGCVRTGCACCADGEIPITCTVQFAGFFRVFICLFVACFNCTSVYIGFIMLFIYVFPSRSSLPGSEDSHLLDCRTRDLNFLLSWQRGAVFMKTLHFINLVEVLKGLREDLMVGIFVSSGFYAVRLALFCGHTCDDAHVNYCDLLTQFMLIKTRVNRSVKSC